MTRTPNSRLRLLLQAAGWNRTQCARAVRIVAAEHGRRLACDHSAVSRWLAGARPRPPAPAFLLEALTRRLGRPVTARQAGLTSVPDLLPDPPEEADPLRALARLAETELDPVERRLSGAAPFRLTALAVPEPPPPRRARPAVPSSGGRRAGRAEAEQMQTMTAVLADAAERHGGGSTRATLAAYLAHDVTAFLHAPAADAVHRLLLSEAARLTILLGRACADCGDDAAAQRHHRTAARLAADADDRTAFALALRALSAHAHDLGHHDPAVLHLAQRAVDGARGSPPAVQAYTQTNLAVVQARHDRHAALAALARAERCHGRADASPGPFTAYPAGALLYQRAQTLAGLGDHDGAADALAVSLRMRAPGENHARALSRARLAETRLRLGHLDAALLHWQAFLDDCRILRSARAARRLRTMRQHLRPHRRRPAVAALLHRADVLAGPEDRP